MWLGIPPIFCFSILIFLQDVVNLYKIVMSSKAWALSQENSLRDRGIKRLTRFSTSFQRFQREENIPVILIHGAPDLCVFSSLEVTDFEKKFKKCSHKGHLSSFHIKRRGCGSPIDSFSHEWQRDLLSLRPNMLFTEFFLMSESHSRHFYNRHEQDCFFL
jgi:hypothetical protein